jgi:hypothetical protein
MEVTPSKCKTETKIVKVFLAVNANYEILIVLFAAWFVQIINKQFVIYN